MPTVTEIVNSAVAEYYCKNKEYDKGLELYKELISESGGKVKEQAENDFIKYSFEYASALAHEDKWGEALLVYRDVMTTSDYPITVLKNIGLCLKAIKKPNEALLLLESYKEKVPNNTEVYKFIGEILYSDLKDYPKAIEYYEKAMELGDNTFRVHSMLGHLYSTYYRDKHKEEQLFHLRRAYELEPENRIAVKNLAYVLGKFRMPEADEYYEKLLQLEPLHSDLHSYGAYLVRCGRLQEGFKYLRHRL